MQKGISQEELAERAELHRTYVSDVERGARNLSLESINRLARALDISVAALFPTHPRHPGPTQLVRPSNWLGVNILLVEDNADDVMLTQRAFEQARLTNHVAIAADGEAALEYLFGRPPGNESRAIQPQLILLDLNLPKVSGVEVLRRIKGDKRTRAIPVIVLTVSQMFSDMEECKRLGADAYLVKPVNFQRLSQVTPLVNLDWRLLKPEPVLPSASQVKSEPDFTGT